MIPEAIDRNARHIKEERDNMKIGVSSYSWSRYLSEGKLDLFGVISATAEIGFTGIEFTGLGPNGDGQDPIEFAKIVKDKCAEAKLEVLSWTIGADFLKNDVAAEIERLKGQVDIAAALGSPTMRHDATGGFPNRGNNLADYIEALPIVAKGYSGVTEYAADKGVKTMIENHGFFFQDSDRIEALIEKVNNPNFGALIDIGNFLCADEEPTQAVKRVAPYAFHVHAKDFHVKPPTSDPGEGWFRSRGGVPLRGAIVGHGNVDTKRCIEILKEAGYQGYLSIEFEGMEDNRRALEIGYANLKRFAGE
jgi:sugar phosphate isomerase/epimerase